uniref:Uncharacterized protein n=1 Tax=viral metagenome TaxID=1070528 RepID=A0A6C0BLC3_9ZZZZ
MGLGKISKSVLKYIHVRVDDEDFEYIVYKFMRKYLSDVGVTDDEKKLSKAISVRFSLDRMACNLAVGLFTVFYDSRKTSILDAQTLITMSETTMPPILEDVDSIRECLDKCCHRSDLFTMKLLITLCLIISRDWIALDLDPKRVNDLIPVDCGVLFEVLAMCCYDCGVFKGLD